MSRGTEYATTYLELKTVFGLGRQFEKSNFFSFNNNGKHPITNASLMAFI
jgi:hypothetical protein